MNKSILILKPQATSLADAERFLANRDWQVQQTTNLKEAIRLLLKIKPQFFLICLDHPNPVVLNLPNLIKKTYGGCVIISAEKGSSKIEDKIFRSNSDYKILPPVTGPSIERISNKYYRDLENANSQAAGQESQEDDSENNSSKDKSGVKIFKGAEAASSNSGSDSVVFRSSNGTANDQKGSGYYPDAGAEDDDQQSRGLYRDGQGNDQQGRGYRDGQGNDQQGRGVLRDGQGNLNSQNPDDSSQSEDSDALNPFLKPSEDTSDDSDSNGVGSYTAKRQRELKKMQGSWVPVQESLMVQGAVDTLKNTLNVTSVKRDSQIDVVSNLACITVESPRFSGYLITAMGKNKKIDQKFIAKIQTRLTKFLRERGEDIKDGQSLELKLKEVPFEDWALEYAEFMRKSSHDGSEVAMAFFPRTEVKTVAAQSANEEMASVKISEFTADAPVHFNLYIHLPVNNKYVLYTPRGGIFYGEQKDRLEKRGVADLHIMKEELEQVDKYRAENYLNEKINQFEEKERQNPNPKKPKKAA